ncbi:MAG: SAF domain-containing protein [Hyphomicrobiales bacterium]|nr:SAF domain-containing protein [Hyphomicrobiales bacterium]
MNLHALALARLENGEGPVRAGVIGAGKFGSMFLNQVPTSPLEVTAIADLDPERAKTACRTIGWEEERIESVAFVDDGRELAARDDVDVVLEVTGSPVAGIAHARAAFASAKHIVMVNVEADVLAGPLLAREAQAAGVVYSMAYGDQPALVCEIVDWARAAGFEVVAAGKGTKYLPSYHASTPDTVWDHYGLTADEAKQAGMNPQMFNSFLDGTKSGIEMTAIANACDLTPSPDGLQFPDVPTDELQDRLIPVEDGGLLHHKGEVEVVSSLFRDGTEIPNNLRWGVYAVFEAPNDYAKSCFAQYGLKTDKSGQYSAMYRPYHLIGLELGISVLSAALRGEPTGQTKGFVSDVVSVAKRDLKAGEVLDGEGGFTVWGKAQPAAKSLQFGALPIGLAHGVTLTRPIKQGETVRWQDVLADEEADAVKTRRAMEQAFA